MRKSSFLLFDHPVSGLFWIIPNTFSQNCIIKFCSVRNKVSWEREKRRLLTIARDLSKEIKMSNILTALIKIHLCIYVRYSLLLLTSTFSFI